MSTATEGYGSSIASSPDGITYTTRAEVAKIGGPNSEGKSIEVTHLLSPNAAREFKPGIIDGGEVTLELNFTKAEAAFLYAAWRTLYYWKITFSQASTFVMVAFITKFGDEVPVDDKISMSVTLKVTGLPVFTQ